MIARTLTTLLCLCALATAADTAPNEPPGPSDWRAFRGTDGSGTSPNAVARSWSDDENIAWKTPLPGPGSSSPIVVGDAVFITCWSGYAVDTEALGKPEDLRRHLLRVDRMTGKIEWNVSVAPASEEDEFGGRMATHGYASSTPVSDGERVYVFFGKSGAFAYDLGGKEIWRADVGKGSSRWKTGSGSSPTLCGDLLIVNASDESHSLHALDKNTGKVAWRRDTTTLDQAYGTPLVAGSASDRVVVLALLGEIWGLAPESGEPKWSARTPTNGALAPSVIAGDGVVYSLGGQTQMRSHAVRLGGKGDVTESHLAWTSRFGSYVSTPLLVGYVLFWVDDEGIACRANAATGEIIDRRRLRGGACYASPVRAGDLIYAVSRSRGTYVLSLGDEIEIVGNNRIAGDESEFDGTPAVSGDRIFLRSDRFLYCIAP